MDIFASTETIAVELSKHEGYALTHPVKNEFYLLHSAGYVMTFRPRDFDVHTATAEKINAYIQYQFVK